MMELYDQRSCELGEGPLWHPVRKQLFWFDIVAHKLLSIENGTQMEWHFDEHVSAAGWIDNEQLLIASESGLYQFDLASGQRTLLMALEADNAKTRSNDGRTDPWGGFWIGTMGKNKEKGAGAIYRYYLGELKCLYHEITIPNSICFSPDRRFAYYTDTITRQIMRQRLTAEGWPDGGSDVFIDLRQEKLNPDGSVVDAEGCLWNAQWGASRVARYGADGMFLEALDVPAKQPSCPSFGGDALNRLFATSAIENLDPIGENDGRTFCADLSVKGQSEHQVRLV